MKIVHISTSDKGGAGVAAMRLHLELIRLGMDSHFISKYNFGAQAKNHVVLTETNSNTFLKSLKKRVLKKVHLNRPNEIELSEMHLKNRPKGFEYFSFPFSELEIEKHPLVQQADIIHLNWVSEGFLNYPTFFKSLTNKKMAWTLHDMNPFTGGCHHADSCLKYENECTHCPQLQNTIDDNYAFEMQSLKNKLLNLYGHDQLKIVTPSAWIGRKSASSKLMKRFSHKVIHNGIDTSVFYPVEKSLAREKLNLPLSKKILLFVSNEVSNERKGIRFLQAALSEFQRKDTIVCTLGKNAVRMNDGIDQVNLGFVTDEKQIALAYNAADVFVLPSLAENFPNTVCESLCCGTPVVSFNVGGLPELVDDSNGILVNEFDASQLRSAIENMLNAHEKYDSIKISAEAHKKVSISEVAKNYIDLYHSF